LILLNFFDIFFLLESGDFMDTIAKRMKLAMSTLNMSQSELVRKTGIGKSSISTYLTGEYEPKQKNLYKIANALNVNESWLMGYDVPMERKATTSNELLDMINSLDETRQKQVLDYLEFLIAQQNKD
jgi:transcriptional regulator with XRE-family HTH domain